ncbi:predicted protein [Histoplasma mississippiense (nom. inval.)]|nr:predicted protein [Histoplasma mississippiense (nom. inval.)]EDN06292.1 predicted protein [Histoplasma mississippiense (nom. inval.)]
MNLNALLAASVLALPASSLLIAPPAIREVNGQPQALNERNANRLELNARCVECPFPQVTSEKAVVWDDGFDSFLSLNFTTEDGRLLLNGEQMYPMLTPPASVATILYRPSDGKTSFPLPVGYVFERLAQQYSADRSGAELLLFNFIVIDIAGFPAPVDAVSLRVIKLPHGDLFVIGVDTEPTNPTASWRQCRRNAKCLKKLIISRLRAILSSAFSRAMNAAKKIKGCVGRRPTKGMTSKTGKPHHGSKGGSFAHAFARALHGFVVPALLGLFAGLFACIVGVIVGQGIAALWARYRRSSTSCNNARVEHGNDLEKKPLFGAEENDLPPQYEKEDQRDITILAEKE